MRDILSIKLVEYLRENNPDVLFSFQDDSSLVNYINQKIASVNGLLQELREQKRPEYITQEMCMDALTIDLRPSKYLYIKDVLEEEFIIEYHHLFRLGILRFEIINLISICNPLFEAFYFNEENEDNRNLRYTIIGTVKEYFELSEKENRETWLTMPIINF